MGDKPLEGLESFFKQWLPLPGFDGGNTDPGKEGHKDASGHGSRASRGASDEDDEQLYDSEDQQHLSTARSGSSIGSAERNRDVTSQEEEPSPPPPHPWEELVDKHGKTVRAQSIYFIPMDAPRCHTYQLLLM
jgi:hypothetical protein